MAKTLAELRMVFNGPDSADKKMSLVQVRSYLAGKAGQWMNQQSHIDREEAINKAYDIARMLFTEDMYSLCVNEDFTPIPGMLQTFADQVFQILAWHYQFKDPDNLGHSVITRRILDV